MEMFLRVLATKATTVHEEVRFSLLALSYALRR